MFSLIFAGHAVQHDCYVTLHLLGEALTNQGTTWAIWGGSRRLAQFVSPADLERAMDRALSAVSTSH